MAGKTGTSRWLVAGMTAMTLALGGISTAHAETSLLNVSYDVTREPVQGHQRRLHRGIQREER